MTLSDDVAVIISKRVTELALRNVAPGSTQEPCRKCGAMVWLSPATRLDVGSRKMEMECVSCWRDSPEARGSTPKLPPLTREFLKAHLRISDQELDELADEVTDHERYG